MDKEIQSIETDIAERGEPLTLPALSEIKKVQ